MTPKVEAELVKIAQDVNWLWMGLTRNERLAGSRRASARIR
jgi:hypothetical protein